MGRCNRFTSFGGLVARELNAVTAEGASVLGGKMKAAGGAGCVVASGTFYPSSSVIVATTSRSFAILAAMVMPLVASATKS
jgi:hypothetical protein